MKIGFTTICLIKTAHKGAVGRPSSWSLSSSLPHLVGHVTAVENEVLWTEKSNRDIFYLWGNEPGLCTHSLRKTKHLVISLFLPEHGLKVSMPLGMVHPQKLRPDASACC